LEDFIQESLELRVWGNIWKLVFQGEKQVQMK